MVKLNVSKRPRPPGHTGSTRKTATSGKAGVWNLNSAMEPASAIWTVIVLTYVIKFLPNVMKL